MFTSNPVLHSFAVKDLDEAEKFYGQTLGLDAKKNDMGILEITFGDGSKGMIYPKPDFAPATFTVLMIIVKDIKQDVTNLTGQGVKFEIYTEGQVATDEQGITKGAGPKVAWFKDPAGNILSLLEDNGS